MTRYVIQSKIIVSGQPAMQKIYLTAYHHQSELVGDVAVPVSVRQAVLF